MHRHIFISKNLFVSILLFIAGYICIETAADAREKYLYALDFKSYAAESYVEDTYVVGEIDSYVVKENKGVLGSTYSGQSETWVEWFTRYDTYTVPVADNRYIRVMVKDRGTLNDLERFSRGEGEPVSFQGIVYQETSEINYEWYEGIEGFDTDVILSDVVIKEVNLADRMHMKSPGIMFVIMALICFIFGDAIEIVTVTDDEEI